MDEPTSQQFLDHLPHLDVAFAPPIAIGEASLHLWEALAKELVVIIGESGFQSLYSRCLFRMAKDYPWIRSEQLPFHQGNRFVELQMQLDAVDRARAEKASRAHFTCFMELLTSMIGAGLSTGILNAAWSQPESNNIQLKDRRAPTEPP